MLQSGSLLLWSWHNSAPGIAQATVGLMMSGWYAVREASPATWERPNPREIPAHPQEVKDDGTEGRERAVLLISVDLMSDAFSRLMSH